MKVEELTELRGRLGWIDGFGFDDDCNREAAAAECRARSWYARMRPGGWEPCEQDEAETEDLNRLAYFLETGTDALYETLSRT